MLLDCSENLIKEFINHVCIFIVTTKPVAAISDGAKSLVRSNTDKLAKLGDFYIPNDASIWFLHNKTCTVDASVDLFDCKTRRVFGLEPASISADANDISRQNASTSTTTMVENCAIYNVNELTAASKHWTLRVSRATICENRCLIYLDRINVFRECIPRILNSVHRKSENVKYISIKVEDNLKCSENVTEFRKTLLGKIVKNLVNATFEYTVGNDENSEIFLHVTTKSSLVVADNVKKIVSGNVCDPKLKNKLANMSAEEYIR